MFFQATRLFILFVILGVMTNSGIAEETSRSEKTPRPTPLTRPEMKQSLEDIKLRQPRIPLPDLTEVDRQILGERQDHYETRLKYHYLGQSQQSSRGKQRPDDRAVSTRRWSREADPNATLEHGFKVELFWIVSRVNNCHYCLGHQETKLLGEGRSENRIAALDGDWSDFEPREKAAFEFARRFTYQPHLIRDADIESLQQHFTDLQIIEMMLSMSWNNSINRWKEAAGVPQNPEEGGYSRLSRGGERASNTNESSTPMHGTYLTPTSPAFQNQITSVAALTIDPLTRKPTTATVCARPPLESREQTLENIARAGQRTARLPLASVETTRAVMSLNENDAVTNWMRLLSHFPVDGARRGRTLMDAMDGGGSASDKLSPTLKAQLSWIVARQDRSHYVLANARRSLHRLGWNDNQVFSLDGDWTNFSDDERACFRLAKNLAASPVVLTDDQVTAAVQSNGPAHTVQAIHFVTQLAALCRLAEAAGLPFE